MSSLCTIRQLPTRPVSEALGHESTHGCSTDYGHGRGDRPAQALLSLQESIDPSRTRDWCITVGRGYVWRLWVNLCLSKTESCVGRSCRCDAKTS